MHNLIYKLRQKKIYFLKRPKLILKIFEELTFIQAMSSIIKVKFHDIYLAQQDNVIYPKTLNSSVNKHFKDLLLVAVETLLNALGNAPYSSVFDSWRWVLFFITRLIYLCLVHF